MLIDKYLKQGDIQPEDMHLLLIALDEIQDRNHEYTEACDLIRTLATTPAAMSRRPQLVRLEMIKEVSCYFYGEKYCRAHFQVFIPDSVQIIFEMKKGSYFRDKTAMLLVKLLNRPRELTPDFNEKHRYFIIRLAKRLHELYA